MPYDILGFEEDEGGGYGYEDIVGDDDDDGELLGADDEEDLAAALLGARPRGRGGRRGRLLKALKAAKAGALVKRRGLTKARNYMLGFASASLAAAGTETVTRRPQVIFKGRRISVSDTIASSFTITDIRIGKNSQMVTTDALPAETFSQRAFGSDIELDTCQITMDFVIAVSNISNAAATFRCTVYGRSVE